MQQLKEQHPLGRAVKQVIMLGATIWGAGHAIEAKQPQIAELFSTRASHSQRYTGDLGFGSRSERANNIEVTYRGKSIAAIPASSFSQPQRGFDQAPVSQANSHTERQANRTKHNAGYGERWMDPRVRLASMSSSTEAHRNEPILPFTTFDQLSPLAAAVVLPGKWNKRRMMLFASMMAIFASCASPALIPPVIETLPGPVVGITPAAEVMGTPLVNEVLTSTPAPRIETPVVTGGSYPTEVSVMESPKVYSYGGPEGRENMDKITRQMFDRYIAELAREGKIQGATPEELYINFDKKYDFNMFVTDDMLTRLIQGKSGGEFLVPENMDGQVYRDLQLPYDTLFQSGVLVDVGSDTFNLREFQADRIGGVGAWPVFVHVDAQSIPVSWVNMDSGGIETPIQVASTVATSIPEASATPSGITVEIGGETVTVNTTVKHSETTKKLDVDPTKVQVTESDPDIGKIYWYRDEANDNARYIWNEHIQAWTPEFGTSMEYAQPELSPYVSIDAYYDGSKVGDPIFIPSSVTLSDALYLIEHPDLIKEESAGYPYYRVTLFGNNKYRVGYELVLTGPNQYLLADENKTDVSRSLDRPFAYFGVQQTKDTSGNIIYVIKKANWNPTEANPEQILTTNMGFDKAAYEEWFKYSLILTYLSNSTSMTGELVPIFPSPAGQYQADNANSFFYETQPPSPHVAGLQSVDAIQMFDPTTQALINLLYPQINKPFDAKTNPGSYLIGALPNELSNMILSTAVHQFYH